MKKPTRRTTRAESSRPPARRPPPRVSPATLALLDGSLLFALAAWHLSLAATVRAHLWRPSPVLLGLAVGGAFAGALAATRFRRRPPQSPDRLALWLLVASVALAAAFSGLFPAALALGREWRFFPSPMLATLALLVDLTLAHLAGWGLWLALRHSKRGEPEVAGPGVPPAYAWLCSWLVVVSAACLWRG